MPFRPIVLSPSLSGVVDGADYARVDATFNNESTQGWIGGWINGDFDYNNKVDGADYALIDSAFNAQTGLIPSGGPTVWEQLGQTWHFQLDGYMYFFIDYMHQF